MIFVDTGAWYVGVVPDDVNHIAARAWLDANTQSLVTTDFVVDETLTLLKVRGHTPLALDLGESLFAGELADIMLVTEDDIRRAWQTFRQYRDKQWSFTDCTSKVVLERLHVSEAFSFDRHFHQFGSVTVVP
ncbi:MAG: type II toxin-antitoxin system VapC family toxin [Pirellulales bacterium]|nr:type II toxin-antitoxin system VapC family toxin [Pirellulales bacterium]